MKGGGVTRILVKVYEDLSGFNICTSAEYHEYMCVDLDIICITYTFPKEYVGDNKFSKTTMDYLLTKYENTSLYPNEDNNYWIEYLARNKFFSFPSIFPTTKFSILLFPSHIR